MNIFYLHNDPQRCAQMHCDKHVVKMILEYAQLLSTAHHILDGVPSVDCYKMTHKNHPSAVWARETSGNYWWLWNLLMELCGEYTYRYGKIHATQRKGIVAELVSQPHNIQRGGFAEPPICMKEEFKLDNVIESYHNYYLLDKVRFAKWTKREEPKWWSDGMLTQLTSPLSKVA